MGRCNVCKTAGRLQICSGCKAVQYCGQEHQKQDWPAHKALCKNLTAAEKDGILKVITTPAAEDAIKPQPGETVWVDYTGRLADGTVFDSSKNPGREPIGFPLGKGRVIQGWDDGVATMKVGEKAVLYIASRQAYGPEGSGPIPGNSPLIFDVELVKVDRK